VRQISPSLGRFQPAKTGFLKGAGNHTQELVVIGYRKDERSQLASGMTYKLGMGTYQLMESSAASFVTEQWRNRESIARGEVRKDVEA